jgi:hypothetical protein
MNMLILVIVLTLVGLEAIRRQRKAVLDIEFQFRLFRMRDGLRELAVRDPNVSRNWVFAYLDSTTAKAIGQLPRLSVWKLLALELAYKDDERFETLSANLERELAKAQFRDLKRYADDLMGTFGAYITERHSTLHVCVHIVYAVSATMRTAIAELRKRSLEVAMKSPETSTLLEYAPDFGQQMPCPV